jgi:hypothetical protein
VASLAFFKLSLLYTSSFFRIIFSGEVLSSFKRYLISSIDKGLSRYKQISGLILLSKIILSVSLDLEHLGL